MLKVTLASSPDPKSLEALSNAFNKVLDDAGKVGFVRIYAYPTGDAIAAMLFVARRILAAGVRPVIGVSIRPPEPEGPMVLLGYDSVNYKAGEAEYTVLAISSGELRGKPTINVYLFEGEGSVSSMALAAVAGSIGYRGSWDPLLALSGSYLGRYVSREGKLHGVDRLVAEELTKVDDYSLEPYTGLKAYKPHVGDVCKSLARTVNPYYPALTGDEDYCREALRAQRVGHLVESSLVGIAAREDDIAKIVEAVFEIVRERGTWNRFDESVIDEYIGGFLLSRQPLSPIQDLRMAGDVIVYSAEVGGMEALAAIVADLEGEYQLAEKSLEDYALRLPEAVSGARPRRLKLQTRFRVYLVDGDRRDSPYLLWRALSLLGHVEKDSVLVVKAGDDMIVSPLQVEAAAGYGALKRLVETRILEGEGLKYWMRASVEAS